MKHASLFGHIVEVYDFILKNTLGTHRPKPADAVIDQFFRSRRYLGSHDRRFIAETAYGMLRFKKTLEWVQHAAGEKTTRPYDLFQLLFLYLVLFAGESIASLKDDAVALLRSHECAVEEMLVSAVSIFDEKKFSSDVVEQLAIEFSFPEWIVREWVRRFGVGETARLCSALNTAAPLTLRVNLLKTTVEGCQQALEKEGVKTERTQFSPFGLRVLKRLNIFQLKSFRDGLFEVQDEGSQLLPLLVDPKPASKVIDACAGGGGKSLELAALMRNRGEIFALDVNAFRLEGLRKRIRRSGTDTIRVRAVDGAHVPTDLIGRADNVFIDAPCSGLGTIRRNPGLKWSVTEQVIAELHSTQLGILSQYAQCVKPGGRLVYATCTFMSEENENVVEIFLQSHPEFTVLSPVKILERYNLASLAGGECLKLFPHIHGTDGFFATVFQRTK
ncbi:MAG: methyltransferase domain-containing protein [Bacteroidota bacterium]|nr:methyltransferase domain-containing protein [Bacteroidota bacterium]